MTNCKLLCGDVELDVDCPRPDIRLGAEFVGSSGQWVASTAACWCPLDIYGGSRWASEGDVKLSLNFHGERFVIEGVVVYCADVMGLEEVPDGRGAKRPSSEVVGSRTVVIPQKVSYHQ